MRKEILYGNGLEGEVIQNNPTPECEFNGTKCYDGWVWVIYLYTYIVWKVYLTAKITVLSLFCEKRLIANYPTTEKSIDKKETDNLFSSEHGREQREGDRRCIRRSRRTIRPFTGWPRYKDAYCTRCDQWVGVTKLGKGSTQEKQGTVATWKRPETPGEGQSSGCSPHKQAVCVTIGT